MRHILHSSSPPLHKMEGVSTFDGNGVCENFCWKRGAGKIGGLSGNKGLPYYTEVLPRIPHDASQEKNLNVFIFPLLIITCYKTTVQITHKMIGIVMVLILLI